jgi:hypothetical protein
VDECKAAATNSGFFFAGLLKLILDLLVRWVAF